MKDKTGYVIQAGSFVRVTPYAWQGVTLKPYKGRVLKLYCDRTEDRPVVKVLTLSGERLAVPATCEVVEVKRYTRGKMKGMAKAGWIRKLEVSRRG